jgi:hypothetical protein
MPGQTHSHASHIHGAHNLDLKLAFVNFSLPENALLLDDTAGEILSSRLRYQIGGQSVNRVHTASEHPSGSRIYVETRLRGGRTLTEEQLTAAFDGQTVMPLKFTRLPDPPPVQPLPPATLTFRAEEQPENPPDLEKNGTVHPVTLTFTPHAAIVSKNIDDLVSCMNRNFQSAGIRIGRATSLDDYDMTGLRVEARADRDKRWVAGMLKGGLEAAAQSMHIPPRHRGQRVTSGISIDIVESLEY